MSTTSTSGRLISSFHSDGVTYVPVVTVMDVRKRSREGGGRGAGDNSENKIAIIERLYEQEQRI